MAELHQIQHIAITFDDGSVGIMYFVLDPNVTAEAWNVPGMVGPNEREATDEAIAHDVAKSSWGDRTPVSWRRITPEQVLTDRTYRNAWKDFGDKIDHDMPKARAIHRDYLRADRATRLTALDAQYLEADERGDQAAKRTLAAQKQKLRDVTNDPRIEAATTADALKLLTLDTLIGVQA